MSKDLGHNQTLDRNVFWNKEILQFRAVSWFWVSSLWYPPSGEGANPQKADAWYLTQRRLPSRLIKEGYCGDPFSVTEAP